MFSSKIFDQATINQYLRIVFRASNVGKIEAAYCKDLFADEIEREQQGLTQSKFFTENFVNRPDQLYDSLFSSVEGQFDWICPNMTEPTQTLEMKVYSCMVGEKWSSGDENYAAGEECKTYEESHEIIQKNMTYLA